MHWRSFGRTILFAACGAAPGVVIAWIARPQTGLAVAILGAIIGALRSIKGVSLKRAGLHALGGVVGGVPGAEKVIDDAADAVGAGREPPPDPLMNWVAPAGHKRRNGWMMWLGLSLGAVSAAIVGLYDAIQLAQGDEAFVLPLALGDGSRGSDVLLLILGWSIWGGAVGAICASAGYRRPVLLSGLVMSAFGGLIALSAIRTDTEVVWRLITYFSTGGLGFAILILVVDDVGCWWDAPRRCTIPKRRRRRFSSILRSFRFLSHPAWRFVGATLVLLVLMLRFVSRSRDVPEYARPQEPLIQEDVDGWERSLRNVDEETKNTAAYRTTLMLLGTDESELAADAHDEEGDASLSGSAADELEAANPRESDTTPASPDQTPASSADRPSAETP